MKRTTNTAQMKERTKLFALRVVRLFRALPRAYESQVMGRQLLRSATSVAANYRAISRARSKKEFVSKLGIVVEEIDESCLWLELMVEAGMMSAKRLANLAKEANELLAIFAASWRTSRRNVHTADNSPMATSLDS